MFFSTKCNTCDEKIKSFNDPHHARLALLTLSEEQLTPLLPPPTLKIS